MKIVEKTVKQIFEERVGKDPDKTAVELPDRKVTWSELDRLADLMASRLYMNGVRKGSHVGIWCVNSLNWIVSFISIHKMGAVSVPINTGFVAEELGYILDYSDISLLLYGSEYKERDSLSVIKSMQESGAGKGCGRYLCIGGKDFSEEDFSGDEKDESAIAAAKKEYEGSAASDMSLILFTSGTTSKPKGVMLSAYNMVNSSIETSEHMKWGSGDRMLIAVPMFHCFGITSSLLSSINCGFTMYVIPYPRSRAIFKTVEKYRITLLNGVPSMFLAMIRNPDIEKHDLSSLRKGIIAGSSYSPEEYMLIRERIPSLKLYASYGQTETSPCVSIGDEEDTDWENSTAAGRIIKATSVRIQDTASGRILGPGLDGEIQVKGYNVASGYYRMPEETRKTFTGDGWLRTGDIGRVDERGFLYVTGRIKEMIIRGGENISPKEIENAIAAYPGVALVKVVGLPHEVLKETIAALVVPKEGAAISEEDVKNFIKVKISGYKIPEYILTVKELPMNSSGKILLEDTKKLAAEMINNH